jgi:hypothetical protein
LRLCRLGFFLKEDVWVVELSFPKEKRKKQGMVNRLAANAAGFLFTTRKPESIEEHFLRKYK